MFNQWLISGQITESINRLLQEIDTFNALYQDRNAASVQELQNCLSTCMLLETKR